jgi:hypothetical protein
LTYVTAFYITALHYSITLQHYITALQHLAPNVRAGRVKKKNNIHIFVFVCLVIIPVHGSLKVTSDDFTTDLADPTSAAFKTKADKYGVVVSIESSNAVVVTLVASSLRLYGLPGCP